MLQTLRSGSKWTIDLELIQRRKERAYSFVRYAQIHDFVEGPEDSDDDEEDKEDVDEEIQADTVPSSAADIAAASTPADTAAPSASTNSDPAA